MLTYAPGADHTKPPFPAPPAPARGRTATLTHRGISARARWLTLGPALVGVAALYLVGLGASGYANSFYSAAAQAGSRSWEAWFFGSLDASNAITVDKPPAAMWVMGLSVRLFGLSSWSILVPEALMGVGTASLLYALVRRALLNRGTGSPRVAHWAGLAAALASALMPAAALMFRFNNPDALLVLLTVAAAYCVVRALEKAGTWWLVGAGALIGFAFLTKMLQAFLILPAFALVYLIAAPTTVWRRIGQLLAAFVAMIVGAGWYLAIFELTPASKRPYMGGSQTNSMLELVFGYNGFGRITGNETGSVGGGTRGGTGTGGAGTTPGGFGGNGGGQGGPGGGWGQTGILRMFSGASGQMASWLIPAALILTLVALIVLWRRKRTDLARAALIMSAGWLVVTGLVFSFMAGIYHDYYTVALAPAVGATVGLGAAILWGRRHTLLARAGLAAAIVATGIWGIVLTQVAGGIYAIVGIVAAVVGVLGAVLIATGRRGLAAAGIAAATVAGLAGPTAYSLQTAATPHQGSIVTAGPVSGFGRGGGPGGQGGRNGGFPGGQGQPNGGFPGGQNGGFPGGQGGQNGGPGGTTGGANRQPGGPNGGTTGGKNGGTTGGTNGGTTGGTNGGATGGTNGGTGSTRGNRGGQGGGMGGLLEGAQVSAQAKQLLQADASHYTWVAATVGAQNSASYQLATQDPVMAVGGFNGSDPSPTLAQFEALVAQGKIHYFIGGGQGGMGRQNGGSQDASQIATWVEQNFTPVTVGSATFYDLTHHV